MLLIAGLYTERPWSEAVTRALPFGLAGAAEESPSVKAGYLHALNVAPHLLRRVLRANGVTFVRSRRALFVPLTEIQRKIPPLWESVCLASQMRREGTEVDRPERPIGASRTSWYGKKRAP